MKNNLIYLYREYVRCADMCSEYNDEHKTNIQPRECLQLKSATGEWVGYFSMNEPNFYELLDHKMRFAAVILEGRPMFIGETMTTKHEIEIRDLPEGWRAVEARIDPDQYNKYVGDDGCLYWNAKIKLEKIKPRRIVLEDTQGNMPVDEDRTDWIYRSDKWWRIVEEE